MAKKKGFMTPERKKKLRTLLRKKAAEELKKEQERKAEERLRVIAERCGTKADIDNASVDDLKKICQVSPLPHDFLDSSLFLLSGIL